jgi:hypothetical protein
MIEFTFRVNDLFLLYPSHPLTVPRSKVDYREVRLLMGLSEDVWVHLPTVGAHQARMYYGRSGFGPYYQLRFAEPVPIGRTGLSRGDRVRVLLFHADGRLELHIQRFGPQGRPCAA